MGMVMADDWKWKQTRKELLRLQANFNNISSYHIETLTVLNEYSFETNNKTGFPEGAD